MATYKVEQLPSPLSVLGEGPHWDIASQSLYYCDIYGKSVHRYVLAENKTYNATVGKTRTHFYSYCLTGNNNY